MALNPTNRIFLNLSKFDSKKKFHRAVFEIHNRIKLKLWVFLAGHSVAMMTNCVTKMIPKCLPVIGQLFDTITVPSIDKEW